MKSSCGCCTPEAPAAPRVIENRPALAQVSYRVGTYATFREAALQAIAREPKLLELTTREDDDYSITFIDLAAALGDVLTFYQERYFNEGLIRTARFRESIVALASLLDYRLRPGVAAQTSLAFTVDPEKTVLIPRGQKVQSIPEAGEQPQTFETLEPLLADGRLNRLRVFPSPVALNALASGRTSATLSRLDGPRIAANLAAGASVVLFNDGGTAAVEEKRIASVVTADDRVVVTWTQPLQRATWTATTRAFKFRRVLRVFGHNAPPSYMTPSQDSAGRFSWRLDATSFAVSSGNTLHLDGLFNDLSVGQKLLIASASGQKRLVTIQSLESVNATVGPLTASVTRLTVSPNHGGGDLRTLAVYELLGDELVFWHEEYAASLGGSAVYLPGRALFDDTLGPGIELGLTVQGDAFKPGRRIFLKELEKGRRVFVSDSTPLHAPVLASIKSAPSLEPASPTPGAFCHLVLELSTSGTLAHDPATAVLLGNVAPSSHGETVFGELVGSGDASATFLRFPLRKQPLTYLPSATPAGATSTLELRVDGVRWNEVPGLYGARGNAQVYELRHPGDGSSIVQFGDGKTGARPPTGLNNLLATYRVGSGVAGRVRARSLTTLLAKPPGLNEVENPLPAEGGADLELLEQARENAPRSVRTLGRAVSLEDFVDLVKASGEVSKAHATWVWDGLDRAIHLTVAGQAAGLFSPEARRALGRSLDAARDRNHRVLIDNFVPISIELEARIGIDVAYDVDAVLNAARSAALNALSFEMRGLGQPLHVSDLYRVLQDVSGVVYVDIDRLQFKRPLGMSNAEYAAFLLGRGATTHPVQGHLRVFSARPDPSKPSKVLPAELARFEVPAEDCVLSARVV